MTAKPKSDRSRLRRSHERGAYDHEAFYKVLDAGVLCHVGYVIDGLPYVTPTFYWRDGEHVYWHGSSASRMLRASTGNQVCFNVALLDGFVLARSGFHSSVNYRSVTLFGEAEIVSDIAEKRAQLDLFIEQLWPGRNDEIRSISDQELKATTVLSMRIDEGSAKVRTGPPIDDEEDYDLPVWAGVVPVRQIADAPIPDPQLPPGTEIPEHIKSFIAVRYPT